MILLARPIMIFHRFVPIFEDVFGPENGGTGTPAKLRKGKKILLWHQVRTTTWLLFIYAKSNFPGISDDLGTFSEPKIQMSGESPVATPCVVKLDRKNWFLRSTFHRPSYVTHGFAKLVPYGS